MALEDMPNGVSKIRPDKTVELLSELIEVCKDKDYEEYLISINEDILDIQKKLLISENQLKEKISQAETLGMPDSSINRIVEESKPLIESQLKVQDKLIDDVSNILKENQDDDGLKEQIDDFIDETNKRTKFSDTDFGKKLSQQFSSFSEKAIDTSIQNVIGPLQLITKPLEDFFGLDIKSSIKESFKGIFSKDKKEENSTTEYLSQKLKPTRNDLMKGGILGASSIFISDAISDLVSKLSPSDTKLLSSSKTGILDNVTEGGIRGLVSSGIGASVFKGIGIASIATSVIWGVIDGIKAYGEAENWGVSTVSASIAGFFAGSEAHGGIKNAFKNAPKLALSGAGIGLLVGGPVGGLAGGLVGAVLGGVLGFIGPETLAQGLDDVGTFLKDNVGSVIMALVDPIISGVKEKFLSIKEIYDEEGISLDLIKESFIGLLELPVNFMLGSVDAFDTILTNIFGEEKMENVSSFLETIKSSILVSFDLLVGGITGIFDGWKERAENIKDIFADDETSLSTKLKNTAKEILWGLVDTPINFVTGIFDTALEKAKDSGVLAEFNLWFDTLQNSVSDWFWSILPTWAQKGLHSVGLGTDQELTVKPEKTVNSEYNGVYNPFGGHSRLPTQKNIDGDGESSSDVNSEYNGVYNPFGGHSRLPTQVNDAIIMNNGKIIHTHQDDNIIATKNDPKFIEKSQSINDLSNYDSSKKLDKMISTLEIIANLIDKKKLVVTNNTNNSNAIIDYSSLRIGQ